MNVAKITPELATQVAGTLSNDNIRHFNPVQDINGNWVIDLQMAIDNSINHIIIEFQPVIIND